MNRLQWLSIGILWMASFADAWERAVPPAVVTRYCSGCHGTDGNSALPYIPRLAGLSVAYSEHRLASFRAAATPPVDEAIDRLVHLGSSRKGATVNASARVHMIGVASTISDQELYSAAHWYAEQIPAPGKSRHGSAVEEGRNLFHKGVDAQGLHACESCHGPNAEGTNRAPRLAGQNSTYLISQLADFRDGERHDSPEMVGIARIVAGHWARVVALYLESR